MSTQDLPPLVVDPDAGFLRSLTLQRSSTVVKPVIVSTVPETLAALDNLQQKFGGIFINPKIAEPWGIPILKRARQHRPTTPIFFIHDDEKSPIQQSDLTQLTIVRALKKPITYQDISQAILSVQLSFDSSAALEQASNNSDLLGVASDAQDQEFVSILASCFVAGTASYFDVYVKLGPGKYVKVLKAGDAFSPERLASYLSKGVAHFFLRQEAQEQYLRYCEKLSTGVIKLKGVAQEIKVAQVLNHGQETLSFLRHAGLKESTVRYAEVFADNVKQLTRDLRLEKNEVFKNFLAELTLVDHGVATAMIAALLSQPLKFEADRCVSLVGLASLFHDIGLLGSAPLLIEENEDAMTPEELIEFHKHPKKGAEILGKVREISPTVVQAVAQHHERRNRRGFPDRLGSGGINRVAEVVGISEEFVKCIARAATEKNYDPFRAMEVHVFNGFSTPVIGAFRSIFMSTTRGSH